MDCIFSGKNGSSNVFGQFESGNTINSSIEYLFRIPSNIGVSSEFAATCGNAMIRFSVNSEIIDFLSKGVQHYWQSITNVSSIGAESVATLPTFFWTGVAGGNRSWIIGTKSGYNTFSSSYNYNKGWDNCNSKSDTTSSIKLMYR